MLSIVHMFRTILKTCSSLQSGFRLAIISTDLPQELFRNLRFDNLNFFIIIVPTFINMITNIVIITIKTTSSKRFSFLFYNCE